MVHEGFEDHVLSRATSAIVLTTTEYCCLVYPSDARLMESVCLMKVVFRAGLRRIPWTRTRSTDTVGGPADAYTRTHDGLLTVNSLHTHC